MMAQITISVNGTGYNVGCPDNDEPHVRLLAQEVEQRLKTVRSQLAPENEAHALFLTALFLADELQDLRTRQIPDAGRELLERAKAVIGERQAEKERIAQAAELAERLVQQLEKQHEEQERETDLFDSSLTQSPSPVTRVPSREGSQNPVKDSGEEDSGQNANSQKQTPIKQVEKLPDAEPDAENIVEEATPAITPVITRESVETERGRHKDDKPFATRTETGRKPAETQS